jgi:uncharacterized protein YdaU (DUF1376 family)
MMHYYQFNIADWALHTAHLTLEEEAVYRRLLDHYYDTEQPLPKNTKPVIRRLRLSGHEETVKLILEEFFFDDGDNWRNRRADSEISIYQGKAETARANGKKGGRPKKSNDNLEEPGGFNKEPSHNPGETQSVILANPEKTGSKANQELRTINQELRTINQELETSGSSKESLPKARKKPKPDAEGQALRAQAWRGYSEAYKARYGDEPLRNATVNSKFKQFCGLVPIENAGEIAAYYVGLNNQFYLTKRHPVGLLVSDAEAIYSGWRTGASLSQTGARLLDRTESNHSTAMEAIRLLNEKDRRNGQ